MITLFQKRHYVEIARILSLVYDRERRREMAYHFAAELRAANPNFDEKKFFAAVRVTRTDVLGPPAEKPPYVDLARSAANLRGHT